MVKICPKCNNITNTFTHLNRNSDKRDNTKLKYIHEMHNIYLQFVHADDDEREIKRRREKDIERGVEGEGEKSGGEIYRILQTVHSSQMCFYARTLIYYAKMCAHIQLYILLYTTF